MTRAALHHVQRQDVRPDRPQRDRERPEAAGPVDVLWTDGPVRDVDARLRDAVHVDQLRRIQTMPLEQVRARHVAQREAVTGFDLGRRRRRSTVGSFRCGDGGFAGR